MRYILVEAPDPDQLSKTVQSLLAEDWELYGNPIFAGFTTRPPVYVQALTNEQDERERGIGERATRAELSTTLNTALGDMESDEGARNVLESSHQ